MTTDNIFDFVKWFRSAAPYIHTHRSKTFVIQFDRDLIDDQMFTYLIHDIALLNSLGIQLIIVFGVRSKIEQYYQQQNIKSVFANGLRQTDKTTMAYVKQTVGVIKIEIEALLSMGLPNSPMQYAQTKVSSGNFITAKPVGVIDGVDLGFSGIVRRINTEAIIHKLKNDEIVLIPPLGYSLTGEVFNLRSVEVAVAIASALATDKLFFLMSGFALKDEQGEDIHQLTQLEAENMLNDPALKNNEQLSYGIQACKQGVQRIHFLQQDQNGSLLQELFSRDGIGTLLSADSFDQIRAATIDDIGGILELIKPLEQQGILVRRSREKIETDINDYTVLVRDGSVIACAAIHVKEDSQYAELACFTVNKNYQKLGKGEMLFLHIKNQAINNGINKLFVLTTHANHWFVEHGFTEIDIDEMPECKQKFYNYQRNSRVLMATLK